MMLYPSRMGGMDGCLVSVSPVDLGRCEKNMCLMRIIILFLLKPIPSCSIIHGA